MTMPREYTKMIHRMCLSKLRRRMAGGCGARVVYLSLCYVADATRPPVAINNHVHGRRGRGKQKEPRCPRKWGVCKSTTAASITLVASRKPSVGKVCPARRIGSRRRQSRRATVRLLTQRNACGPSQLRDMFETRASELPTHPTLHNDEPCDDPFTRYYNSETHQLLANMRCSLFIRRPS